MDNNYVYTKWKVPAYIIGGLGILLSIALYAGSLYCSAVNFVFSFDDHSLLNILVAVNLIANISWTFGVGLNNEVLMIVLLGWSALMFAVWLGIVLLSIFMLCFDGKFAEAMAIFRNAGVLIGTAFFAISYILTVICFGKIRKAIKRSRSEIPSFDVAYIAAPTKCREFDVY
ncbi:uncharacterized protein LOC116348056 [Contarinia nasturtii]|uniref:uncharacterized protein LOC116348056 n=1 Tax=Contarinia nasturtii TaxID=265458 RepID=UPI0012D4BD8A|nr:uncharacterized protein LOC116348056 [Contarinia nasturtii]